MCAAARCRSFGIFGYSGRGVGPAVEMFTHVNVRLGVFMICAIMRICILNAPLKGWDTHNALKGAYVFLGSSCA